MRKSSSKDHLWAIDPKDTCRILLTPYCSSNCVFCDHGPAATAEQLLAMQNNAYAAISDFRQRGFNCIEICGEDPLEYGGLSKYVKELKKNGIQWIILSTNGLKLADMALSKELSENIDQLRIPLYGSKAEIHDEITRTKNSFTDTIKGIKNVRSLKRAKIELTTMLLKQNCLDMPHILDLMHDLHCDSLFIASVLMPQQRDENYYIPHKYQGVFLKKLIRHAQKSKKLIKLTNFPYCVIGYDNNFTHNQPEITVFHALRGFKEKTLCLDSHRKKIAMCKECLVQDKCCGFLVMDILKYGAGDLKPIKELSAN